MTTTRFARAASWRRTAMRVLLLPALDALAHTAFPADAHAASFSPDALADLTLEHLGSIVVTSVSRRQESLASAAASRSSADPARLYGARTQ